MMENAILFHLSANKKLTEKVASILNLPIGKVEIEKFADGELMCRNLSNVKGKDVYVIQSTGKPAQDNIFEILIFVDALRNCEAKSVNLVIPYFGYSRQDRPARTGEPISAKVVAKLYQSVGADKVITFDLHTSQIQGFFSCPVVNIDTIELFGNYFVDYFKKQGVSANDIVIVSPDHGSQLRVRDLSSMFDHASIAIISKRRPAPNKSEITSVVGDVKDKTCIIIDDILDTCGTINNAFECLKEHGAKEVYVAATHAVFSGDINTEIKGVVVTDTLEKEIKGVKVLSVAELLAKAIMDN